MWTDVDMRNENDKYATWYPHEGNHLLGITHRPYWKCASIRKGTIAAFRGEKGESQLDKKGNVFNTFNMQDRYLFPFLSIITLIDPN